MGRRPDRRSRPARARDRARRGGEIAKAEMMRLDAPARFRVFDTPRNTRLTQAQCTRLRETATANGLLQPIR
jgi:hypothetical protein